MARQSRLLLQSLPWLLVVTIALPAMCGSATADTYGTDPSGQHFYTPDGADKAFTARDYARALKGYSYAIEYLETRGEKAGDNRFLDTAYWKRMRTHHARGDMRSALRDLLLISTSPNLRDFGFVGYHFSEADTKAQLEVINYGLRGMPERAFELHQMRAALNHHRKDHAAELVDRNAMIERARTDDEKANAYIGRSYLYMYQLSRLDLAFDDADAAVKLKPGLWSLQQRATALDKLGKPEDALRDLRSILSLPNVARDHALNTRLRLGKLNRKLGRLDLAYAEFSGVLAARPNDAEALGQRMLVLMQQGKLREAEADRSKLRRVSAAYLDKLKDEIAAIKPPSVDPQKAPALSPKAMRQVWEFGRLVIFVPFIKMANPNRTDNDKGWQLLSDYVRASRSKAGVPSAAGLDAIPHYSGTQNEQFGQALNFSQKQQAAVARAISAQFGPTAADLFTVASASQMLSILDQLGQQRLARRFVAMLLASGPRSGLPEEIWRPLADAASSPKPGDIAQAFNDMNKSVVAHLSKQ